MRRWDDNAGLIVAAIFGLVAFCVLFGASVTWIGFTKWLLKPSDNLATLIGGAAVVLGLGFAGAQLQAERIRQEAEGRARRHQEYDHRLERFRTWQTNSAIMMILNFDRDVKIRPDCGAERVDWDDCAKALVPACYRDYLYEPQLTAIRDCFNDMIENMSRLLYLEREGLIREADVKHLCATILRRISRDDPFVDYPIARNFRLYVQWRNSGQMLELFQRYGRQIQELKAADVIALETELLNGRYGEWRRSNWGTL